MKNVLALAVDTQENYFDGDFNFVTSCTAKLQAQVMSIAKNFNQLEDLSDCEEFFTEGSIYSWEDKTDENGNFIGGVYCVAYGEPTIYIDTIEGVVKGYWWIDFCEVPIELHAVKILNEFFATLYYC